MTLMITIVFKYKRIRSWDSNVLITFFQKKIVI